MNTYDYSKAHILVTGASRGLGLAFIKTLSNKQCAKIYAGCRSQEGIDEIQKLQLANVIPILLDVTEPQHINTLLNTVGQLDILINNAGIASACTYTDKAALENATAEMNTHYFGPLALTQKLLPRLKESGQAGIINIASMASIANFKAMGTYSASKAAFHFFTQGLRAELAEYKIFVQGVYPGPFDTRLAAGFAGYKPSPDEIANLVLDAFNKQETEVFPDEFARSMYATFLESPKKLQEIFSS